MRRAPISITGPVSTITYDEYRRRQEAQYPNFRSDEDIFGSWLSSLTGIHINPLNLGATHIDVGQLLKTAAITAGVIFAAPVLASAVSAATPAVISTIQAGGKAAEAALTGLGAVKAVKAVTTPTPTVSPYTTVPINSAGFVDYSTPAPNAVAQPLAPVNVVATPVMSTAGLSSLPLPVILGIGLLAFVLFTEKSHG